jgi:hypothetical protein
MFFEAAREADRRRREHPHKRMLWAYGHSRAGAFRLEDDSPAAVARWCAPKENPGALRRRHRAQTPDRRSVSDVGGVTENRTCVANLTT